MALGADHSRVLQMERLLELMPRRSDRTRN